jgi:multimeric flavodoxin WrbA
MSTPNIDVRTGQGSAELPEAEFKQRYRLQFADPAFGEAAAEVDRICEIAWKLYQDDAKNPRSQKAGAGFADPEHEVSVEWLETRARILEAEAEHERPDDDSRILLICASPRTDETCPSEMSKTFRLAQVARECFEAAERFSVDFLDLSRLTSEYGRQIHPCKGCVSTAMPLCHWPCSCYPNHYLGQVHDWMNELYPRWVAAHGVMIITPVHWYQAPSVLKLMIDRLVCADGGNPDPTSTHGKIAEEAKALELKGWPYPKHLAGRRFSIVVHGDVEGAEGLRRDLRDWLTAMGLVPAGAAAILDRYIGYYEPYATSHAALDKDTALQEEVRLASRTLIEAVGQMRRGHREPGADLPTPRAK